MQTRTVTAHISVELAEQIDTAAERLRRPRATIVEQALQNWISLEERRHQMILEGLKDIDEGRVVDHSEIEAWLKTLKD